MKLTLIIGILTCVFKSAIAQSDNTLYFNYQNSGVNNFLVKRIIYPKSLIGTCTMPFTYVKFKVNKFNAVDSLTTSNTNADVNNAIKSALSKTAGYWRLENVKNKWLIIPVMFVFLNYIDIKGCDYQKEVEEQIKQINFKYPENINNIYLPIVVVAAGGLTVTKY